MGKIMPRSASLKNRKDKYKNKSFLKKSKNFIDIPVYYLQKKYRKTSNGFAILIFSLTYFDVKIHPSVPSDGILCISYPSAR